MKYFYLFMFLLLTNVMTVNAQNSLDGIWEGGIRLPNGTELQIKFTIRGDVRNYTGTLDIPQQGAIGLRLTVVTLVEDSVTLTFEAGPTTGTFTGKMESEKVITGNYTQGGPVLPFGINKTGQVEALAASPNETSLIIQTSDVQIGGTINVPDTRQTDALVIMSSGSGAQDRDSNIYDFKIFASIAEHLSSMGIASFRYDDRGIGESSGNFSNASIDDLTNDLLNVIEYFKSSEEHNYSSFILLGHSQGGLIVAKTAVDNPNVSHVILMASPTPPLSEILRYQGALAYAPLGMDSTIINAELDAREALMAAIQKSDNVDEARTSYAKAYRVVLENLPPMQRAGIPDMDALVRNQTAALAASYETPALGSFLFYDPVSSLSQLTVPVLGLFGSKDTQVTPEQNKGILDKAMADAGVPYQVYVIEDANHLFQKANSGQVAEYPTLEKAFIDGFLEKISGWILPN